jgi:hypothetical protein
VEGGKAFRREVARRHDHIEEADLVRIGDVEDVNFCGRGPLLSR